MRWPVDRIGGALALVVGLGLWLAPLAPVEAQEGADISAMMGQFVRSMAIWGLLVLGLYIVCLVVASRAAGLSGGLVTGCLATLVGVVIGAVVLVPLGWLLGDYLNQRTWSLVGQTVGLAALVWGIKLVFRTGWPRALLTLLIASILAVTISGVALVLVF